MSIVEWFAAGSAAIAVTACIACAAIVARLVWVADRISRNFP